MALTTEQAAALARLNAYNGLGYHVTSNPYGFARGGNQIGVFVAALKDVALAGQMAADGVSGADGSAGAAAGSAQQATDQAGIATTKAGEAAGSATLAGTRAGYAAQWANNPENVPVSVEAGGDGATTFSARHQAIKAAATAASVDGAAIAARFDEVEDDVVALAAQVTAAEDHRSPFTFAYAFAR
jgi:hypothetical protein